MAKTGSSIRSKIRSLAIEECPNHQRVGPWRVQNYCWMREKSNGGFCVYFSSPENPRCGYFEVGILPLDQELKDDYFQEINKRREENGREAENRTTLHGESGCGGSGDLPPDSSKIPKPRVPLDKFGGKGILPRPAFHGVGFKKTAESR